MAKKHNGELLNAASQIMNAYSDTTKQVAAKYGVTTCELDILSCLMQQKSLCQSSTLVNVFTIRRA